MTLTSTEIPALGSRAELAEAAIEQARNWVLESKKSRPDQAGKRLARVLQDPNGLSFMVGFIDRVLRPEDIKVSAQNLQNLKPIIPKTLPKTIRGRIRLGALLSPLFPRIGVQLASKAVHGMLSHLIVDASPRKLGKSIRKLQKSGVELNISLPSDAVLGEEEAKKRLRHIAELLTRKDIGSVSLKVSSVVKPHSPWAFDEAVEHIVEKLSPLYEIANNSSQKKFINLEMQEYRDLDLTMTVFQRILDKPEFKNLSAGIVLQAYLPDALGAMIELQQWASLRVDQGGAPIKVSLVKGSNLAMERVDAELHGWPLATFDSKQATDTNYKRVLNYALTKERVRAVRIGVSGQNLFDLAFAWILANQREVAHGIDFQMLYGTSRELAKTVKDSTGKLTLYTPAFHPKEFDLAIGYLLGRLAESATEENFTSAVFELGDEEIFTRERDRFLRSLEDLDEIVPIPNRLQDRNFDSAVIPAEGFSNAPLTDPAIGANRRWAYQILRNARNSELGLDLLANTSIWLPEQLEQTIGTAQDASQIWASIGGYRRAKLLHDVGVVFERNRDKLIELMVSEAGITFDQADSEVSQAVDFAHYYAEQAIDLEKVDGAIFVPHKITVVAAPWNSPVGSAAGSALAALAAGSAVVIKTANETARCGAFVAKLIRDSGIPKEVIQDVQIHELELYRKLVSDPRVDQVILNGSHESAQLAKSFRSDLKLLAQTIGRNSVVITPHADLDQAAKDLARSAFVQAGQKSDAVSVAILVGSVAKSEQFRRKLVDAVKAMRVDYPTNPESSVGPLISKPEESLLETFTTLDKKQRWILQPQPLDESGKLWSLGIKENLRRGATSYQREHPGPVLSIFRAPTLEDAIAIQNSASHGLAAGLHSLNRTEIETWIRTVQAGNLYVNREITGAIVQRQPLGGWKKSSVGPGAKEGGPNYLAALGAWKSSPSSQTTVVKSKKINSALALAAESVLTDSELSALVRASQSDDLALREFFSKTVDSSNLSAQWNRFRYLKTDCELRISATASSYDSWRAILAFLAVGGKSISAFEVPVKLAELLRKNGIVPKVQTDADWAQSLAGKNIRVRFIGRKIDIPADSPLASPEIAIYWGETVESGRVELLPYFKEQTISITAHRLGKPALHLEGLEI